MLRVKVWAVAVFLGLASASQGSVISVDFVGAQDFNGYFGTPQTQMAASEVAGVAPVASWNSLLNISGSGIFLSDSGGNTTSATIGFSAQQGAATTAADAAGDSRMMKGGLFTNNNSQIIVEVDGLPLEFTGPGYDVYLYFDTTAQDNASRRIGFNMSSVANGPNSGNKFIWDDAGSDFNGTYIAGDGVAAVPNWPAGPYPSAANYYKYGGMTDASFSLVVFANVASDSADYWAQLSGMQIVAAPEPVSAGVLGLSGLIWGLRRRR